MAVIYRDSHFGDVRNEGVQLTPYASRKETRYPTRYQYLRNHSLQWSTRLQMEHKVNPAIFLTLTFEPGSEPEQLMSKEDLSIISDEQLSIKERRKPYSNVLSLIWANYMKALRNHLVRDGVFTAEEYKNLPLRYYAITERGENNTERLHFHALLFGLPHKTFKGRNKDGKVVDYVEYSPITDIITKCWSHGFVFIEGCNGRAINYVTKYIHKRMAWPEYVSYKSNGLGLSYMTPARVAHLKSSLKTEFHIDGKKFYMPRYIKAKCLDPDELAKINEPFLIEKVEKELYNKQLDLAENAKESALCLKKFLVYPPEKFPFLYEYEETTDTIYVGQFVCDDLFDKVYSYNYSKYKEKSMYKQRLT